MKDKKVEAILRQIAKSNGVTVAHVRKEIQSAMDEAMANPDPIAQAKWSAIPRKGNKPTVDEFIIYMASKL